MTDQRFQEILAELERWNFREVLDMTRRCFRKQHQEEEKLAFFKLSFYFNYRWRWKSSVGEGCIVDPDEVVPTLRNLSDEDQYAIYGIIITPTVVYEDESGEEKTYQVRTSDGNWVSSYYCGDVKPFWQELRYPKDALSDDVIKVSRDKILPGCTLGQGPYKVFTMDDSSVFLMKDDEIIEMKEKKKSSSKEELPNVKTGLYHKRTKTKQEELKAAYFTGDDPVPSGCQVTVRITQTGGYEYTGTKIVRKPNDTLTEGYNQHGVIWKNFPEIWGFHKGKMIVGTECPRYRAEAYCDLVGMLAQGVEYSFPLYEEQDEDDDSTPACGTVYVSWDTTEINLEIKDGVLKTIPDAKEFVVPEEVKDIHFQALLTAPSLRKITLHSGVTNFSRALQEFHRETGVKLEVEYQGGLQQWFDLAVGLAGDIGCLTIEGKEYDFYRTADVVIPEGIRRIGGAFFENSSVIRSVILPPEVVEIGYHAFAYCRNLQSVRVLGPASVGGGAFVSCRELVSVYLADGVYELGSGCFDFLHYSDIFIPASVKRIDGVLCQQNDGWSIGPRFLCEAVSKPKGWYQHWNLSYFDPRFGMGHGYDYYHLVEWGCKRDS